MTFSTPQNRLTGFSMNGINVGANDIGKLGINAQTQFLQLSNQMMYK